MIVLWKAWRVGEIVVPISVTMFHYESYTKIRFLLSLIKNHDYWLLDLNATY